MNVTFEHKDQLIFIGYYTNIQPGEGYEKCPEFWEKEYTEKYARLWETMKPENPVEEAILENGIGMFAICADTPMGFQYWIAGLYQGGPVPEGLRLFPFDGGDWVVFTDNGPLPHSLQCLNDRIWDEWFPGEGQAVKPVGGAIVEVYSAGDPSAEDYEIGIWVPVILPEEPEESDGDSCTYRDDLFI